MTTTNSRKSRLQLVLMLAAALGSSSAVLSGALFAVTQPQVSIQSNVA